MIAKFERETKQGTNTKSTHTQWQQQQTMILMHIIFLTSKICDSISCGILSEIDCQHQLCHISLDDVRLWRLATLKFETKLQNSIRIGITILKICIWGGISSDIRSEITFYGSTPALP